ncbi:pilus assembly protein PilP [Thioalkalivibrio sp. XN8]|uniref:pilus assembly protein PilP n=1 Tax=Thioalkalivibrio sp. XN8 TaxID=2712863 RepID=UPI0013EA1663|nr:pilus assembly protein PilP [Thioalkalivibrio sp. XN8]NGP52397.1 pilus assembly protein PilP [Thioalkalivibrio sp. XN8]
MTNSNKILLILALALTVATTSGCARSMSDLDQYIAQVNARPGGAIEPLPQITTYETVAYERVDARSPFVPDLPAAGRDDGGVRPDATRKREYLEGFPLDTFRMVGTLYKDGQLFGLVQTSDKLIHRVVVGNYVGQNDGRIISITESAIQLLEIVPDGLGGYTERAATIGLGET